MVKFWRSWDVWAGLRETVRAAETLYAGLQETVNVVPYTCSSGSNSPITTILFIYHIHLCHTHKMIQSHHNMPCIFNICRYIYICSFWLQMVLEWNLKNAGRCHLTEHGDTIQLSNETNLEMHFDLMNMQSWSVWVSMSWDIHGGHDPASLDMYLEAVIE